MPKLNEFDAARCKRAVEKIADVLLPYGKWAEEALDDLITDIEALHRRAQERDSILDSVMELEENDDGYVDYDYVEAIWSTYATDNTATEDLSL